MKIAVLVSGGVDSSVALRLLRDQGHELVAFYLKIWLEDETAFLGSCPWVDDLGYIEATCQSLNVPLVTLSAQKEYYDTVVAYTLSEIKAGHTPNPDIFCNAWIKFGFFLNCIDSSFDKVATGHYAQVRDDGTGTQLWCSPDSVKDQTYFLSYLRQNQLARAIFPIGHLDKPQVRSLAHEFNLPSKNRKDSQGICFLGHLKFNEFLHHYMGDVPGPLVEFETGTVLGAHKGFWYHTIGQRQGSGLAGGPWYVVSKNVQTNTVYVSRDYYHINKKRDSLTIFKCNWIGFEPNAGLYQVKLRHGPTRHDCCIEPRHDGSVYIKLLCDDQGIAQGQFAVLYGGNRCLGSGVIG